MRLLLKGTQSSEEVSGAMTAAVGFLIPAKAKGNNRSDQTHNSFEHTLFPSRCPHYCITVCALGDERKGRLIHYAVSLNRVLLSPREADVAGSRRCLGRKRCLNLPVFVCLTIKNFYDSSDSNNARHCRSKRDGHILHIWPDQL